MGNLQCLDGEETENTNYQTSEQNSQRESFVPKQRTTAPAAKPATKAVEPSAGGSEHKYKIASDEDIEKACNIKPAPDKISVEVPEIIKVSEKLDCSGKITKESGSSKFWAIVLNDDWQQNQDWFVEQLSSHLDPNVTAAAEETAQRWAKLMGIENPETGFFVPTSGLGVHISLGHLANEKSKEVVQDRNVKFKTDRIVTFPHTQSLPMNFPGDHRKTEDGRRDYAALWFFLEVDCEDFDFPFHYRPHASIGCYGLKNCPITAVQELRDRRGPVNYQYGKN